MINDDLTPAVTRKGKIIWLDADGNREFSALTQQRIQVVAIIFLTLVAALGLGLATGVIEPAPWSPMGQHQEKLQEDSVPTAPDIDLDDFDIPPGWEPAVPVEPVEPPSQQV